MTNYNVTGLNNNTVYHVTVTASNNAGSSVPTGISVITNGKFIYNYICTVCSYVIVLVVDQHVELNFLKQDTHSTKYMLIIISIRLK